MNDRYQMRASDRDRQAVVDRLRSALEDGRLTMDEYLNRMELALQAVTYGDLAPLYADLPAAAPVAAGPATAPRTAAPATARRGALAGLPLVLKVLWTMWLTAVSVNVVVWILVSATSGHPAYPWPLWVAGPYGTVLFAVSAAVTQFRRATPKTLLLSERTVLSPIRDEPTPKSVTRQCPRPNRPEPGSPVRPCRCESRTSAHDRRSDSGATCGASRPGMRRLRRLATVLSRHRPVLLRDFSSIVDY